MFTLLKTMRVCFIQRRLTHNTHIQSNIHIIKKYDFNQNDTMDDIHDVVDDEDEYEDMFVQTSFDDIEWGGPMRGGSLPEPTRFGDWERNGRCTDY